MEHHIFCKFVPKKIGELTSKGSRGYFIESVSDRVCTVLFNEWYCHDEVEVPIKYLKLRNHYDYEMKEYIRYHDITLLVND